MPLAGPKGAGFGPPRPGAILIAHGGLIERPEWMGAKYLPTIKDQKANQRFQEKQKHLTPLKKTPAAPPAKKAKKT